MQLDVLSDKPTTEVGSYFISNYPPFSAWSPRHLPAALRALEEPNGEWRMTNAESGATSEGDAEAEGRLSAFRIPHSSFPPLGLYIHIPFCRKRCHFCYFRVYTDKNSSDVDAYMDALAREIELYSHKPAFDGREFEFVYFGGGTPSFLSSEQLERLVERINRHWRWDHAREVTFECEPGTLKKGKLETIRGIGTTRLSLGVEHFDDEVLSLNGRAHHAPEIFRAYEWAREVGFPNVNIDLIAGMVGDTQSKWEATVEQALALRPDCLTIYQMEVPHNTTLAREAKRDGDAPPVAGWATKRAWVDHAFRRFEDAGYVVSSAYTVVRPSEHSRFLYRDSLWHGSDMVGTGVASFSHVGGVHFQNVDQWDDYLASLSRGELPLSRALPLSSDERLIRELILQLKLGRLDAAYFRNKFGVEISRRFAEAFASLVAEGYAESKGDELRLTRAGILRVDGLLPRFFEPDHRGVRYT